jgi:hypothetical protein
MKAVSPSVAILCGSVLIAAAILVAFRWQIAASGGAIVYRLDRWSGNIAVCRLSVCE